VTETPAPMRIERDGDVAVVVLENPPLNLFTPAVFTALDAVSRELVALTGPQRPDRARAVLFEARGKVVSGGVDVAFFRDIAEGPEPAARGGELWAQLLRVAQTIEDLPVPTVFAAHGLTLTAAFELALCCDILLAAEKASFGLVEIVVGLTPSMGGPQRLAQRAGPARARELVFTGELYPAAVLERWNVVNRVLPEVRAPRRRRTDGRARGDEAARGRVCPQRRPGGRRTGARGVRGAVRHRGPARGRGLVPGRRAREGDLLRPVMPVTRWCEAGFGGDGAGRLDGSASLPEAHRP
jgi:enoyl-CoA hydratase/carnithine racemase